MAPTVLDHYAALHTPYLHARGREGTRICIGELSPRDGENILEIGFGTGQTLVEIAARYPGVHLFGVEKSPLMKAVAEKRLRFSGTRGVSLELRSGFPDLPFADCFFHKIYCESVLAILPGAELDALLVEIRRILRPGGAFVCNESIWRDGTSSEAIGEINRKCMEKFGIPQSGAQPAYAADWLAAFAKAGFLLGKSIRLEGLQSRAEPHFSAAMLRSALFSGLGRMRVFFQPQLRRQQREIRAQEKVFSRYGLFLEGVIFVNYK